jgi:hypothetical protein
MENVRICPWTGVIYGKIPYSKMLGLTPNSETHTRRTER